MAAPVVKPLAVPPDAQEHGGEEILRAFIVDQGLSVSIQRAFDEPSTWGILLDRCHWSYCLLSRAELASGTPCRSRNRRLPPGLAASPATAFDTGA
ncbi:MAG: DUF5076 domain-containing protein [Hyphomicrobiales bacterium]